MEDVADVLEERFSSKTDARESEVIRSSLVRIIERTQAVSVDEVEGVSSK
ncbi:hypothetical protein [Marinomonas sp. 2405UD68-3]